jgi:dynein heavy chain
VGSLSELSEFIKVADAGMQVEVKPGEFDVLTSVMNNLTSVRERISTTDEMFDPLKKTIDLLFMYGQEMPPIVHTQLAVSFRRL